MDPSHSELQALPQTVFQIVHLYLILTVAQTAAKILLDLAGQMRRLVVQPAHELFASQLCMERAQIVRRRRERLGRIGDDRRAEVEVVRSEGPLED